MIPLLVPIGLALIRELAPQIVGMVTGSARAEKIATDVVEAVGQATGQTIRTAGEAEAAMAALASDPALLAQVRLRMLDIAAAEAEGEREARIAQAQLMQAELAHPSLFVAGARPAMTWAATLGVIYAFVGQPMLSWGLVVAAWSTGTEAPPPPPSLDLYELMMIVGGSTGLYALRGVEKKAGVARDNMAPSALADWRAKR